MPMKFTLRVIFETIDKKFLHILFVSDFCQNFNLIGFIMNEMSNICTLNFPT